MQPIFEKIYKDKVWYKGSGSGSLPENTIKYRDFLQQYIKQNKITSILDLGCGDWQFMHLMDLSGIQYTGVEVVSWLVEENQKKWGAPNIRFVFGDAATIKLPDADLVILKDVLQHWSNNVIIEFFKKLRKYNHVLVNNTHEGYDLNARLNRDIENGQARPLDLSQAPFYYPIEELLRYQSYRPIKKVWETKSVVRLRPA